MLWVLWFCFTQFSLDFTLEEAGTVRVPGQIMILLQTSLSAERMENSSMCWINLYSVYLANIYLKAKFSLLQSAINPSAEELGFKPSWYSFSNTLCISLVSSLRRRDNNRITYSRWGSIKIFYNTVIFFCILIFVSFLIYPVFYIHFLRDATKERYSSSCPEWHRDFFFLPGR